MRVLIADDSVLLRQGLALILAEGGHEVVAEAGDGQTLVTQALALRPEVIVADIRMPPSHTDEGLRAATTIRSQWPGPRSSCSASTSSHYEIGRASCRKECRSRWSPYH